MANFLDMSSSSHSKKMSRRLSSDGLRHILPKILKTFYEGLKDHLEARYHQYLPKALSVMNCKYVSKIADPVGVFGCIWFIPLLLPPPPLWRSPIDIPEPLPLLPPLPSMPNLPPSWCCCCWCCCCCCCCCRTRVMVVLGWLNAETSPNGTSQG